MDPYDWMADIISETYALISKLLKKQILADFPTTSTTQRFGGSMKVFHNQVFTLISYVPQVSVNVIDNKTLKLLYCPTKQQKGICMSTISYF